MASLSRTRLRLLAPVAVLALACTRPGDDGVDKDPPKDETDTDVAPTGDTSAGRDTDDTSDSDTSTVTPCDLSTPRVVKATEQLHWFTGDGVHRYTAVLDGWDPTEQAIVFARWQDMNPPPALGGTTRVGRASVHEGDEIAGTVAEFELVRASDASSRVMAPYDWRSPDVDGDGRRDPLTTSGDAGSFFDEHDTLHIFDARQQGFLQEPDAFLSLGMPGGAYRRRYSVGNFDGASGNDVLVSFVATRNEEPCLIPPIRPTESPIRPTIEPSLPPRPT